MAAGSTNMTLAFTLEALQALASPQGAITNAREWTEYIGVVSEEPTYVVTNYTREHRIRQDFFSGPRGVEESLESVKSQFQTDRHVLIGTTDDDAAIAETTDWEYLPLEEAAESAGWTLGEASEAGDWLEEDQRSDWP